LWLAALFQRIGSVAGEGSERAVGSFYLALLNGLMVQWLLDPERAPSGQDMAEALLTILESVRPAENMPVGITSDPGEVGARASPLVPSPSRPPPP
jgi:hypothetical protein